MEKEISTSFLWQILEKYKGSVVRDYEDWYAYNYNDRQAFLQGEHKKSPIEACISWVELQHPEELKSA